MRFKRIISITLILAFCMSSVAFGAANIADVLDAEYKSQINYKDDVFKYDMDLIAKPDDEEEVVEEIPAEVLKHERAVKIVTALGLMKYRDDAFNEDEILKTGDFCIIVDAILGMSDEYQTKTNITHKDVLDVIIKALGYEYMSEKSIMNKVYRENILNGISYNPEKYVSRGEMAQLLYNALNTPVMDIAAAGKKIVYTSSEDNTLLALLFGVEEIEGLVTAANGINLYSNKELKENYIEINRGSFLLEDGVDTTTLLGKKVFGLVEIEEGDKVIFLAEDNYKQSVLVPFDEIKDNGSSLSWNFNGIKGKAYVSSIKNILYNGTAYAGNAKLSEIASGEGTILFISSNGNNYDAAIINKYETFVVERVSARDEKIYIADGLTFNGKRYIDLSENVNPYVSITLNGKSAKATDLGQGYVISVLANQNGYVQIDASNKTVRGEIEEVMETESSLGEAYLIKDKFYLVSSAYNNARKNGAKIPAIELRLESTFKLNALGHIAYIGDVDSAFKYAILKTVAVAEEGLDESIGIRIFTQDNKWNNYTLAKQVVIDGVKYSSFNEIKTILKSIEAETKNTIIRYKLNTSKQISFIDTKVFNEDEEGSDIESISLGVENLSTSIEWNKGKTLPGTKYGILETALIFFQPEDLTAEEEYKVMKQKDLKQQEGVTLNLYNLDDFFYSDLVVFQGKSVGSFPDGHRYMVVTKVMNSTNEKDEDVYVIEAYDALDTGEGWQIMKYTTTPDFVKRHPDIKKGDFGRRTFDANGKLSDFKYLAREDSMMADDYYMHDSLKYENANDYIIGKAIKADAAKELLLFESYTYKGNSTTDLFSVSVGRVLIYDTKTKTAEIATLNDVSPDDRVAMFGGWGEVGVVVYR